MILFTFQDAFDAITAYMGAAPSAQTMRDAKQAIDEALRDLVNAHTWSYLYAFGRINTNAPFPGVPEIGSPAPGVTVQFQVTGGPLPNYMTLTGGTWPSWIADAYLFINAVVYRVDRVIDSTDITLLPPRAGGRSAGGYDLPGVPGFLCAAGRIRFARPEHVSDCLWFS